MSAALALLQSAADAPKGTGQATLHLFGDYYLANPWALAVLPLGLALFAFGRARRGRAAGRVSALPPGTLPRTLALRCAWLVGVLQLGALALAAAALARPVRANEERTITSEGVDILCAIDRSGSMQFDDLQPGKTRLEVVKEVVGEFAARRMSDKVGAADNVGLLAFARYPELVCPFTLDVQALHGMLKGVEMVRYEAEDGTGIGRALAKAVAVLKETDAKSKVVILLTDGENNIDDITPQEAAKLAAQEKIKVYTVLAGRFVYQTDFFGRAVPTRREIDSSDMVAIAKETGGRFFRARDRDELEQTYAEIEKLERTPRKERRYTETFDLYARFLPPAILLYLLAWLSASSWARRLS